MKNRFVFLTACLVLFQATMSFSGNLAAQSLSKDTLLWSWEVSSTVSTQTKSCVLEYPDDLILDWGDGKVDTLLNTNSGQTITHVYTSVSDFTCQAIGFGLSYFKADSKRLKTLDPTKAPNLTYLSCSSNQLTSLNVSNNKQLVSFYCSGNDIATLSLDSCKAIQTLTCSDNNLQQLNVSKNLTLKKLTCHTNSLTSLLVAPSGALSYISSSNCSLQVAALDTLIAQLPILSEVSASKNLYILNNPGSNYCNISSANSKKWTPDLAVVNSTFYIPSTSFSIGDSVCVNVCLSNPIPVIAFELDIEFPVGFVLDTVRSCLLSNRIGTHQLTISRIPTSSTTYKFLTYSMISKDLIQGNNGEILKLYGTMPDSLQQTSIQLKEAVLVDTATNMASVLMSNGTITIEPAFILGDANGDDKVDVTDIVNLISFIYGNSPDGFVPMAADMDKNGKWNVADVTKIVAIINTISPALRSIVFATSKLAESLTIYEETPKATGNHVFLRSQSLNPEYLELCLKNTDSIQACQVDIQLTEGISIKEETNNQIFRQNEHRLRVANIGNNRYRLLLYSLKPVAAFAGDSGVIARIPLLVSENSSSGEYPVRISNSVLTGLDCKTKTSINYDLVTTIDKSVLEKCDLRVWSDKSSALWISAAGFRQVIVSDLMGEIVRSIDEKLVEAVPMNLPQGVYIVKAFTDQGKSQIQKIVVN